MMENDYRFSIVHVDVKDVQRVDCHFHEDHFRLQVGSERTGEHGIVLLWSEARELAEWILDRLG